MIDRLCRVAVLGVLVLSAGGCGGSSSSSSASASTTPASTPQPSTATSLSTPKRTHQPRAHTRQTPATSSTTATTAPAPSTTTAPPPTPAGLPSAPAGLSQTSGYATYELCSTGCSGSVPASLRRALHLPDSASGASCPVSDGSGPVKPLGSSTLAVTPFIGSSWHGARVTWTAAASYRGPVLIRGRQLGGSGAVGFGEGHVPYDELQLLAPGTSAPPAPGGGRAWLSFTRVQTPGCYADQVDGTSFSTVVVFRAAG